MAEKIKDSFSEEIDSRLGEFFGEESKSDIQAKAIKPADTLGSAFTSLQAIVLSIEWEITDQSMDRLTAETDKLMRIYKDKRPIFALLKLLGSVGKYINAKKANAHPDSIKLLHSVNAGIQKVGASPDMPEAEINNILSMEVAKFNKLKQQLLAGTESLSKKEKMPAEKTDPKPVETETAFQGAKIPQAKPQKDLSSSEEIVLSPQDALLVSIEEIKKLIKEEFKTLREELKRLR